MRKKGKGTVYRTVVRCELIDSYASAFEGMQMEAKNGQTILTGEVLLVEVEVKDTCLKDVSSVQYAPVIVAN